MCKEMILMREVICKYHPDFVASSSLRKFGLKNPKNFNVPRLIEESMAATGKYKFIDAEHADFSDGTDCKTASISVSPTSPGKNTHRGEISNVSTAGGELKKGGLRCIVYNPHKQLLRYYYLPKSFWETSIRIHPTSGIGKLVYTYNITKDVICKLVGFECKTFEELAKKKDK